MSTLLKTFARAYALIIAAAFAFITIGTYARVMGWSATFMLLLIVMSGIFAAVVGWRRAATNRSTETHPQSGWYSAIDQ